MNHFSRRIKAIPVNDLPTTSFTKIVIYLVNAFEILYIFTPSCSVVDVMAPLVEKAITATRSVTVQMAVILYSLKIYIPGFG